MTAQRVLILSDEAGRLESAIRSPVFKGVHFTVLPDAASGMDLLGKENFSIIVSRNFSGGRRTESFVSDLLSKAPKTPLILILPQADGPSVLEALRGGASEILFEETLYDTFSSCLEKYLFSGYALLRKTSLDEMFDFCIPVITSTDMGLLASTILEKFREALGASFGVLFREGTKGNGVFSVLAAVGFPDESSVGDVLARYGRIVAKESGVNPKVLTLPATGAGDLPGGGGILLAVRYDLAPGSAVYAAMGLRGTPEHGVLNTPLINFFQRQACLALINAERSAQTQSLIYIDDLTKLYNSRYLNVVLDREMKRSERYRNFFSVLFMDIDFFKRVNDTHGHLVGSRVLVEVGAVLRKCVRDSDTVVRYGGDEFVVLLVETNAQEAMIVAERMRKMVESERFVRDMGLDIRLTISTGVAAFPEHATTKQHLLNLADQAMYRGKESTRNVVYLAPPQNAP